MCLRLSCPIILTISNKMTERRACDVIRVKVAGAVQLFRGHFDLILTAFLSLSARCR